VGPRKNLHRSTSSIITIVGLLSIDAVTMDVEAAPYSGVQKTNHTASVQILESKGQIYILVLEVFHAALFSLRYFRLADFSCCKQRIRYLLLNLFVRFYF
jgi:hypothetical protein